MASLMGGGDKIPQIVEDLRGIMSVRTQSRMPISPLMRFAAVTDTSTGFMRLFSR